MQSQGRPTQGVMGEGWLVEHVVLLIWSIRLYIVQMMEGAH